MVFFASQLILNISKFEIEYNFYNSYKKYKINLQFIF
jgi:hypothetical protein